MAIVAIPNGAGMDIEKAPFYVYGAGFSEGSLTPKKRAKKIISVGFFGTFVTFFTLLTFQESALPDISRAYTSTISSSIFIQKL